MIGVLLTPVPGVEGPLSMNASTEAERAELSAAAFAGLRVGTYTARLSEAGELSFIHVSDLLLQICGLERESLLANPALAMAVVHPADRDRAIQANRDAARDGRPFQWQGRLQVEDQVMPVLIASHPRELPDGRRAWEGAIIDLSDYQRRETELRSSESRLRALFQHLPVAVVVVNLADEGRLLFSNAAFAQTFGYDAAEMRSTADLFRRAYPDREYRAQVVSQWSQALEQARRGNGQAGPFTFKVCRGDGELRDAVIRASIVEDLLISSFEDITEKRRVEEALRLSEQKFRTLVEQANDIIYTLNLAGEFEYLSPNLLDTLGYQPEQISGTYISSIVHPEDLAHCEAFLHRLLSSREKQLGLEYRVKHADGNWRWHVTNASPLFEADGSLRGMLGIGRDISARKAAESRIIYLAQHDTLTGLLNRKSFFEVLERHLNMDAADSAHSQDGARSQAVPSGEQPPRPQQPQASGTLALMFIDLDRFKSINDTHGHLAGDHVLRVVADRLRGAVRDTDCIGRIGGDEFLVLLPGMLELGTVLRTAEKIIRQIRSPIVMDALRLQLSCSIGIALAPQHARDANTLVRLADAAMYQAKRRGRDQVSVVELSELGQTEALRESDPHPGAQPGE